MIEIIVPFVKLAFINSTIIVMLNVLMELIQILSGKFVESVMLTVLCAGDPIQTCAEQYQE
jgi:hypothetical protein